jgi:hypothetical protein
MKKLIYLSLIVLSVSLPGCLTTTPSAGSIGVNPDTVTVAAGTSQSFATVLTGSFANISVKWSVAGQGCSAGSCGTIDQSGNYTAPKSVPSNPLIQVIAMDTADSSKFGVANVTIGPAVTILITQPPANPVPVVAATQSLSSIAAKVSNSSNTTVNWTVTGSGCSGAACGVLAPTSTANANATTTYTAPAPLPIPPTVSIVATSAADSTQTASLAVNLTLFVQVVPGSQTVGLLDTQQFQANVSGQETSPAVTVAWSLTSAGSNCSAITNPCGTITPGGLYQAPAALPPSNVVTVTASASQVVNATTTLTGAGTATVDLTQSTSGNNSQLFDHYAFVYRGYKISGNPGPVTPFVEAGSLIFDGNGNIVAGSVEDDNDGATPHSQRAVAGTYSFDNTDNTRGTISLNAGLVSKFRFVLVPNSPAVATTVFLTDFGGSAAGAGRMELQDKTKFANATLTGGYAVQLRGTSVPSAVGRFDVQNSGTSVANGEVGRTFADSNFGDCTTTSSSITIPAFSNFFTGSIAAVSASGNAQFSLQNFVVNGGAAQTPSFSAYIVSATRMFLIETDKNGSNFAGLAEQQTKNNFTNSDFTGYYSHFLQVNNGSAGTGNSDFVQLASPGTNNPQPNQTIDAVEGEWGGNLDGSFVDFGDDFDFAAPTSPAGFYSLQPNGLGLANVCLGVFTPRYVMYFVSPSKAFVWNMNSNLSQPATAFAGDGIGEIDKQQQQFSAQSNFGGSTVTYAVSLEGVEGNFATNVHDASNAISASGVVQFDYNGVGTVKFILDVSKGAQNTGTTPVTITGTYVFGCSSEEGCNLPDDTFWNFATITFAGTPAYNLPNHFAVITSDEIFFNFADVSTGTFPSNIGGVALKNQ